ncbi:hypothetical protein LRS10_02000 [Phenylobacterium sp. J426]|uniref:hypothetical protein n=1 Tax=Phenylobacterium sp. J426 TaxID=2898439 RepID=UPI0021513D12|nr:hypothetical protein [Phenylobacterium sp. J426]MCR5873074.1 hypothetical protein [Phenylobacterium sp. J426]
MRVFLDFEASSLKDGGFPVEVAWVFEDGRAESHLIRPADGWTTWDAEAEAIHGLGRDQLAEEGADHRDVAARMIDQLSGHALYVTAPSWDGQWLSLLLRAAGLPRHALRLRDADEAHREAALNILKVLGAKHSDEDADGLIAQARAHVLPETPAHRALADAEAERRVCLEVQRLAREAVRGG